MRLKFSLFFAALLACSLAVGQDDKPEAEAKGAASEAKVPSAEEIDKLMEQLDSNVFAERQAAQQKLTEIGKAALPAIEKGTQNVSREVAGALLGYFEGAVSEG